MEADAGGGTEDGSVASGKRVELRSEEEAKLAAEKAFVELIRTQLMLAELDLAVTVLRETEKASLRAQGLRHGLEGRVRKRSGAAGARKVAGSKVQKGRKRLGG